MNFKTSHHFTQNPHHGSLASPPSFTTCHHETNHLLSSPLAPSATFPSPLSLSSWHFQANAAPVLHRASCTQMVAFRSAMFCSASPPSFTNCPPPKISPVPPFLYFAHPLFSAQSSSRVFCDAATSELLCFAMRPLCFHAARLLESALGTAGARV